MSRADTGLQHGDVAPLQIRLTHNGGEVRSGTLRIPASGTGMADVVALSGERHSEAQWRLANLCRIQWNHEARHWQLLNDSHTLMCVRNGDRVPAACPVSIAEGDVLELGLLRFVVGPGKDPAIGDATAIAVARPGQSKAPVEEPASNFDLRDLAGDSQDGSAMPFQVDVPADAFSVLGIAGAQSRSTADVLSVLLGESRRHERRATPVASAERLPAVPGDPAGLIDELHEEFVRVVRDPDQLAGRTDWEGLLAAGGEPAPTLDELSKESQAYPLLRDILQPREGIDRIIEGFEPLDRSTLLDAPNPEDVLSLFAPELAGDARASLPSLTRREHHELSPDSHVRIGTSRVIRNDDNGDNVNKGRPE